MKKYNLQEIIVVLAIAASISINLSYLFSQSIRLDESQSIWVSTKSVTTLLKMNGQDVQTPLYSLLLHFWLQIFSSDIVIARLLSLIFYIVTIPMLYTLIRESSNRPTAILGVSLFALSPFIIWYSQEARTYTLLTFLATANHRYFLRFIKTRTHEGKFIYFLTSLLGLYSHYFFLFLIGAQAIYLIRLGLLQRQSINKERSISQIIWKFISIQIIVGIFFIPWIWYVYTLGLASNTQPLIPQPTSFNLIQVYLNFFLGFQSQSIQSLLVSLWPLFLMILFVVFTRRLHIKLERADYFLISSILPVVLVFFVSFYKPIFLARYLIFVIPPLFTVIAWILINIGRKLISVVTIIILLLMLVSLNYQDRSILTPVKEDYRTVVNYLDQNVTPYDIVSVSAPFTVYPIEYYYSGLARIDTIPQWDRFKQGPIPPYTLNSFQQQMNTYATIYYRIFVILSYNQGYQNQIIDYLDHHYQLLQNKKFASDITVRVYKLRYD